MNKLTFTLKQHTPIIHFLPEQSGATLRATELKPKLDKFLIEHAFNNEFEKYKFHLIGWREGKRDSDFGDKKAFDYKTSISAGGNEPIPVTYKPPLYFGHIEKNDKKRPVLSENDIDVNFFSFNEELINTIRIHFPPFLARTNFGTRQNKGFGSFFVKTPSYSFIDELKKAVPCFFYIEYKGQESVLNKFNDIDVIYKLMKSGINFPDHRMVYNEIRQKKEPEYKVRGKDEFIFKSFLSYFFSQQQKPIGNEKRFIKEKFFRRDLRLKWDGVNKKYIRALLGVCDGVEYKGDKETGRNGKITYKSRAIDRFKSPLTFKIVGKYTVIIPEEYPREELNNIEFTFSHEFAPKKVTTETIHTPDSDTFDLIPFVKEYMDYFNNLDITKIAENTSPQATFVKHAKQSTIKCYEEGGHND